MIALIDYKAGNLTSVRKALAAVGAEVFTPTAAGELERATGLIVPGVGHFAATSALDGVWMDTIKRLVGSGRPLLGICLGLQWLFEGSEESPDIPGLGLLSGRCYRLGSEAPELKVGPTYDEATTEASLTHAGPTFRSGTGKTSTDRVKVPHVGWNVLTHTRPDSIVENVPSGSQVYFTHSYVAPITADTVSATHHGEPFASIVQRGRVAGVQFHPEKSGDIGLQVLRNFLQLAK
jgi:glutamine amidotransferase